MTKGTRGYHFVIRLIALISFAALSYPLVIVLASHVGAKSSGASSSQRRSGTKKSGSGKGKKGKPQQQRFTEFSHSSAAHHAQTCDNCHKFPSPNWQQVRKEGEAFPDITQYPEHSSCLNCHKQQFFAKERPYPRICSVCHAVATPRDQTRYPFPNPAAAFDASPKGRMFVSDFRINFLHEKHLELFSQNIVPARSGSIVSFARVGFGRGIGSLDQEGESKSCPTCHETYQPQKDSDQEYVTPPPKDLKEGTFWLRKGTFKTEPADHAKCFTCHSVDGGVAPLPSDCNTCHKLTPPGEDTSLKHAHDDFDPKLASEMKIDDRLTLMLWSRRGSSRFSHEWAPHDLECSTCHNVHAMNTLNEATKKVPVASCGAEGTGCHVEPDGKAALNTEVASKRADPSFQCVKCHVIKGRLPLPQSHVNAIAVIPKK